VLGRAKTRLIPHVGPELAARLNTAFLQDVTTNLVQASERAPISCYVAYGPAGAEPFFRDHVSAGVALMECCLPGFGDCLFHAIATMLERGHSAACVLNADSPTLPTNYLVTAARLLARPGDRAVLGPSTDGGYYLLGLKQPHRRLFADIDWSTPRVAEQTRCRAAEIGLELLQLDPWYDVDDAATLQQLMAQLASRDSSVEALPYAAPRTREALAHMSAHTTHMSARAAHGP
jgi:rSAM/selenodomain-associated transferase 1